VKVIGASANNWLKLFVPANGSIEIIKNILEENQVLDSNTNYYLVHNGQELREDFVFDQLDIQINSKILLAKLKMSPCKLVRFSQTNNQWWYISTNMDGITFSCTKKIKLTGMGVFRSHENKVINLTLKIIEGTPSSMGVSLVDEIAEIQPAPDAQNSITPYNFKKPVYIKQNQQYTAQLCVVNNSNNYAYTYYGNNGTNFKQGERKVDFTFTYVSGCSTSVETGLFPEFYYMC